MSTLPATARPAGEGDRSEADKAAAVPAFARDYPADKELSRLLTAFQRGDYAEVREHAPALAERSENEEVRAAALDLRRRLDPHGAAAILWGLGVALLVLLFGYYVGNSH